MTHRHFEFDDHCFYRPSATVSVLPLASTRGAIHIRYFPFYIIYYLMSRIGIRFAAEIKELVPQPSTYFLPLHFTWLSGSKSKDLCGRGFSL